MKDSEPERTSAMDSFSVISGRLLPDDTPDEELEILETEEEPSNVIPFPLARVRRRGLGTPPPPPPPRPVA